MTTSDTDFNEVLGEFQEFGPRRAIPVEERWRERFPSASEADLRAWAQQCQKIEDEALAIAELVLAGRLAEPAARRELHRRFPELNPDRIGRTIAQALYFASK